MQQHNILADGLIRVTQDSETKREGPRRQRHRHRLLFVTVSPGALSNASRPRQDGQTGGLTCTDWVSGQAGEAVVLTNRPTDQPRSLARRVRGATLQLHASLHLNRRRHGLSRRRRRQRRPPLARPGARRDSYLCCHFRRCSGGLGASPVESQRPLCALDASSWASMSRFPDAICALSTSRLAKFSCKKMLATGRRFPPAAPSNVYSNGDTCGPRVEAAPGTPKRRSHKNRPRESSGCCFVCPLPSPFVSFQHIGR